MYFVEWEAHVYSQLAVKHMEYIFLMVFNFKVHIGKYLGGLYTGLEKSVMIFRDPNGFSFNYGNIPAINQSIEDGIRTFPKEKGLTLTCYCHVARLCVHPQKFCFLIFQLVLLHSLAVAEATCVPCLGAIMGLISLTAALTLTMLSMWTCFHFTA